MNKYGKLYGIGVGPGDPELLTVKAVKILAAVDVVLAAASTKNEYSRSLDIAMQYIGGNCEIIKVSYPMTRDKKILDRAWEENADLAAEFLKSGKNVAFLTLGDPLIYSTFGYMLRTISKSYPQFDVEIIPGITSYQAAAAETGTILVESGQNLLLTSGVADEAKFKQSMEQSDNVVILKAYRNFVELRGAVMALSDKYNSKFISRLGLDGEQIFDDISAVPEKTHYLSLMLLTAAS
ncbi:precorrin-2 C(20)-methyltransferase [Maridesulfovibrio bastinii]|uniref:precorrin-2 C(20)-methyltransferase n=1 Tax=Maridesulfovibrio bastinii TaxID=47157 RepID=UPI0003F4F335|nr:precorrin-2 C(20)-methyltransferase [Maridesulfovibrio bastinii]